AVVLALVGLAWVAALAGAMIPPNNIPSASTNTNAWRNIAASLVAAGEERASSSTSAGHLSDPTSVQVKRCTDRRRWGYVRASIRDRDVNAVGAELFPTSVPRDR